MPSSDGLVQPRTAAWATRLGDSARPITMDEVEHRAGGPNELVRLPPAALTVVEMKCLIVELTTMNEPAHTPDARLHAAQQAINLLARAIGLEARF